MSKMTTNTENKISRKRRYPFKERICDLCNNYLPTEEIEKNLELVKLPIKEGLSCETQKIICCNCCWFNQNHFKIIGAQEDKKDEKILLKMGDTEWMVVLTVD